MESWKENLINKISKEINQPITNIIISDNTLFNSIIKYLFNDFNNKLFVCYDNVKLLMQQAKKNNHLLNIISISDVIGVKQKNIKFDGNINNNFNEVIFIYEGIDNNTDISYTWSCISEKYSIIKPNIKGISFVDNRDILFKPPSKNSIEAKSFIPIKIIL